MFHYLLLDSSQQMRFFNRLEHWGMPYESLFQGHTEESLPELAPLLIDITRHNDDSQRLHDEIIRIGQKKPCLSKLAASAPLMTMAEHLRQFHLVHMPNGRTMLMRWYDTRILPVWLDILSPDQRAFFTQHIVQWSSIDRFGVEQQHSITLSGGVTPQTITAPLQLDVAQAQTLLAANEPDTLIFELRRTLREEIKRVPYSVLHPFIAEQCRLARKHALYEKNDQVQFMMLALHTSGHFVDHPLAMERLASPSSVHAQSFANWCDALPESVWNTGEPLWQSTEVLNKSTQPNVITQ
ncbi:DUF4123 domain-containing protein [Dyella caseinilytica]|uniref:DUF4123 domain-containing protein n=1 Tax=Dyella caseinilytica TaxID=1849581 RepID=A0ABX7GX11_9GAMM|nr:DUF4123 domain-containing protein [Dyella caseinilytica]QRN55030.1 DUF4123 domain-containing protein [Dyella caseinilytica]